MLGILSYIFTFQLKNKIIELGGIVEMKKSLISVICLTMFMSFFGFLSDVNAVNFEGQEEKYMKLCSSKSLSSSNYSTCKQFNNYLKKKNKDLQSSIDDSKTKISDTQSS